MLPITISSNTVFDVVFTGTSAHSGKQPRSSPPDVHGSIASLDFDGWGGSIISEIGNASAVDGGEMESTNDVPNHSKSGASVYAMSTILMDASILDNAALEPVATERSKRECPNITDRIIAVVALERAPPPPLPIPLYVYSYCKCDVPRYSIMLATHARLSSVCNLCRGATLAHQA